MDWRGDYIFYWPVMDDGRMIIEAGMYEEAKNSTYDPMIKKYFDDAVAAGRLVIVDGSIKFSVNGEWLEMNFIDAASLKGVCRSEPDCAPIPADVVELARIRVMTAIEKKLGKAA